MNKKGLVVFLSLFVICCIFIGCDKSEGITKVESTVSSATSSETSVPPVSSSVNSELSSSPEPIFEGVAVGDSADQIEDEKLIAIMHEEMYPNAEKVREWVYSTGDLELQEEKVFHSEKQPNAKYVLILNIKDMDELMSYFKLAFSDRYIENEMASLIGGEHPLFIENEGSLYYNYNTGGAYAYHDDFSRAKVVSKSADSFEIEVPITIVEDKVGKPFIFKAINQNGYWVFDEFHWTNPVY